MYGKQLGSIFSFYRETLRQYNNMVKQVSPREYGIILQGKRKKKKHK